MILSYQNLSKERIRLKRKSAVADKPKLLLVIKCLSLNKAKFDMMSEKFQKKIGINVVDA